MKNIILINPPIPNFIQNKRYQLPISLMYLAHYLEATKTANVQIIDLNAVTYIFGNLNNVDYIGISCLFSGVFQYVDKMAKKIKEINNNVKIIIGGMHPTIFGKEIIENCPHIDYVVIGEGEIPLRKIISDDKDIVNVYYRKENEIVFNQSNILINDLNNISPPWLSFKKINIKDYYHDLSDWNNPKQLDFKISIPITTTRGCPNNCNFCSVKKMNGLKVRSRNPYLVVNEIEWYYNEFGCNRFSFYDDNIILPDNHMENICSEIIKRKLNIQWETASGFQINKMTRQIADIMVEAGWVRSMFPIESGNDYIRNKIIGKNLKREKIFEVSEYIKNKYPHVLLRALFIIGFPEETIDSLNDTFNMIKYLNVDEYRVHDLIPLPGTQVFEQCLKDSLFLEEFNINDYWNCPRTDFGEYKKFYIKPYNIDINDLKTWREKFDALIEEKENIDKAYN